MVLAGAFYPNYFTFGQPDEEMAVRELAGKDPKTTIVVGGGRPSWGAGPGAPSPHGWQESVSPPWVSPRTEKRKPHAQPCSLADLASAPRSVCSASADGPF